MGLHKGFKLVLYEIKYLFRQKFLLVFTCAAVIFIFFMMRPGSYSINSSIYDSFPGYPKGEQKAFLLELAEAHPVYDIGLTEAELSDEISIPNHEGTVTVREALTAAHRLQTVENAKEQREQIRLEAEQEKEELSAEGGTDDEIKKMALIEQAYGEDVEFELYDFSGWEMYFLFMSSMQPNNFFSLIHVVIIVSAGLLVFLKDRESHTQPYLSLARYAGSGALYAAKLAAVFVYGTVLQLCLNGIYIAYLHFVSGYDMGHWLSDICNVPRYMLSEVNMSIVSLILLNVFLKVLLSMGIVLLMLLSVRVLKQYILILIGGVGAAGALYLWLFRICSSDKSGLAWLADPMSIFKIDYFLNSDIIELFGAVHQTRLLFAVIWGSVLILMVILFYKVWRWGMDE